MTSCRLGVAAAVAVALDGDHVGVVDGAIDQHHRDRRWRLARTSALVEDMGDGLGRDGAALKGPALQPRRNGGGDAPGVDSADAAGPPPGRSQRKKVGTDAVATETRMRNSRQRPELSRRAA